MMIKPFLPYILGVLAAFPVAAQDQLADGEAQFRKCQACHAIGPEATNKIGPQLNGILGRPVAGLEDYAYSQTLEGAGVDGMVWDETLLTRFLKRPRDLFPGTSMAFAGMTQRADIEAIIAYLSTFEADGTGGP